jgi:hypothetical protein
MLIAVVASTDEATESTNQEGIFLVSSSTSDEDSAALALSRDMVLLHKPVNQCPRPLF